MKRVLLIFFASAIAGDALRARIQILHLGGVKTVVSADVSHTLSPNTGLHDQVILSYKREIPLQLINMAAEEPVTVMVETYVSTPSQSSLIETSGKRALSLYQRPFG